MELLQLKYFKTVAETQKISAAAEALFISAPALSTSISRLEKELGMALFDRTNNSIRLNRQGHIFLRYVNQIFASLDFAKAELRHSLLPQSHHVSVATLSSNLWVDLISGFSQKHPDFTLSCTSMRLSQFDTGGLPPQYSFLLGEEYGGFPLFPGELDSTVLFEDRLAVILHPDHPLAARQGVSLQELAGENLLLPMQDYTLYARLSRLFDSQSAPLSKGNSYSSLVGRYMVAEGLGISFATMHTAKVAPEGLCYVPVTGPEAAWAVRLYWRKHRVHTQEEQIFRDFVEDFYSCRNAQHKV